MTIATQNAANKFAALGLSELLVKAVADAGYDTPTPIQEKAIPMVLTGRDLLAAAQTGTGKTAGFTLPILQLLANKPLATRKAGSPRVLVLTPTRELTAQAFQDAMQAKYFSYVFPMNAVVKRMAARQRGVIVNVIGAGGKVASPIHLPGGAANAALMLVTAGMANAYAAQGVRVVAVNPGLTMTERLKEGMAADAKLQGIAIEEALARATSRLPLGRIAEPAEIANAVLFLASQKASYVTGAILAMDGAVTPTVC